MKKDNCSLKYNNENFAGTKFGKWTVLERTWKPGVKKPDFWKCVCECGLVRDYVDGLSLRHGRSKSCGCEPTTLKVDLTGKRFGKVFVISRVPNKGRQIYWLCRCDCGKVYETQGSFLKRRADKANCGCVHAKWLSEFNKIRQNGSDNHMWNPNLTDKVRIDRRYLPDARAWVQLIYEKDNWTCQFTGLNSGFNAHHIESYKDNPRLRFDIENGVTMVSWLHILFHKRYGRGGNTAEQLLDFIEWIEENNVLRVSAKLKETLRRRTFR